MNPVISFEIDYSNKKIIVTSKFDAPLTIIWDAFTNPSITDKWWAPKPYLAVTKECHFENGGQWLYYMLSPQGEKHWCMAEFSNIQPLKSYDASDAFCDEKGTINTQFPRLKWHTSFSEVNGATTVVNTITGEAEDLKKTIAMGFEEGYKMGLSQLNELIIAK